MRQAQPLFRSRCRLATALIVGCLHQSMVAQCPLLWLPGDPIPFAHGAVRATTLWDPDGAGPLVPLLVVGGDFGAGTSFTTGLASFDGTAWLALGVPPMSNTTALTVFQGQLVAAGDSGGGLVRVASWNGSAWTLLGTADNRVNVMAVFNGNLFVGGRFATMNGQVARRIAQWDGGAWTEPGGGIPTGEVLAMASFGNLYVGGGFSRAGAITVGNMAIWNGTAWAPTAVFNGAVRALAVRSGATPTTSFLFAGGDFTSVGVTPAARIAQLTASTNAWTAPPGLPNSCHALHVRNTGTLTFVLHAAVGDIAALEKVWRLNGTAWTSLGPIANAGGSLPTSLAFFNGQQVVGLMPVGNVHLDGALHLHTGTRWVPAAGPGLDGSVYAMAAAGSDVLIGGNFTRFSGVTLNGIALGRPGNWQPLGSGLTGGSVLAVCRLANGDLVAGGDFALAGGIGTSNIARWNGTAWSPLGPGTNGPVSALLPLPNGDIIVGGGFTLAGGINSRGVARWNGTTWSRVGGEADNVVRALTLRRDGRVVAGGSFTVIGGATASRIATLTGNTWTALGSGLSGEVDAITELPNGDLLAGGSFLTAGAVPTPFVARYRNNSWLAQSTLAEGWDVPVQALAALPDGDYVAGAGVSLFGTNNVRSTIARHRGGAVSTTWNEFDVADSVVRCMVQMPNGDLLIGGTFRGGGGVVSANVARLRSTCPAAAPAVGLGCVGAGGQLALTVTQLPWLGSTFLARTTGVPANAAVLSIFGFQPQSVAIASLVREGLPGCNLFTSLDVVQATGNTPGAIVTGLAVPLSSNLVGVQLRHQVVSLELNGSGGLTGIASSNALGLVVGAF